MIWVSATMPTSAPTVPSWLRVTVATQANGKARPPPSSPATRAVRAPAQATARVPAAAATTAEAARVTATVTATHAAIQAIATRHFASATVPRGTARPNSAPAVPLSSSRPNDHATKNPPAARAATERICAHTTRCVVARSPVA
jgi:hypothetical protein